MIKKIILSVIFLAVLVVTFSQLDSVNAAPNGPKRHIPTLPITAPPGHSHSNHNAQATYNGVYRLVELSN